MKSFKKHIVFVVDDNEFTLAQIKKRIEENKSCKVYTFTNATDCISNLYLKPIMIFSDCNLVIDDAEGINGEDLLGILKTTYPDLPVIMYSSSNDGEMVARLMKYGAQDFVTSSHETTKESFTSKITNRINKEVARIQNGLLFKKKLIAFIYIFIVFIITQFIVIKYFPTLILTSLILFSIIISIVLIMWRKNKVDDFEENN